MAPVPAASRLAVGLLVLTLAGCIVPGTDPWPRMTATPWHLVAIEGTPVSADSEARLTFEGETQLLGNGGVNHFFGSYERIGRSGFRAGKLGMTRMAGPEPLMREESRFLELLARADGVRVEGDELELLEDGVPVLRFVSDR